MNSIADLKQWLHNEKRTIVITSHFKPDGDAIGSSMALYQYLRSKNHHVTVVMPNDFPHFISWLTDCDKIVNCELNESQTRQAFMNADTIFCLDYNALSRTCAVMEQEIKLSDAKKVMIDHHLQPESFADVQISNPECGSTCEMVYNVVTQIEGKPFYTNDFAQAVYLGIVTDTGQFNHSVTEENLNIFSTFLSNGFDYKYVNERVFNSYDENRLRFLAFALSSRMKVYDEYRAASITISRQDLTDFQLKTGETEGLVNYLLKLENVVLAVLITDRTQNIKMSFRSKYDFDVNELARTHFNGGGHRNASGGLSNDTLENVLQKFETILPTYKEQLLKYK